MVNIFEDLLDLNKPVYYEGEAPEDLPSEFYTISEDYSGDNLNADNKPLEILYEFTMSYYTNDAKTLYTGLNEAIALLKRKGYIISGVGRGKSSYKGWCAREVDVSKIEYL